MLRSERGQATADLRRCRAENAALRAAAAEAGAEAQPVEILQNTFSDRTLCIFTATARVLIPAECSAVS